VGGGKILLIWDVNNFSCAYDSLFTILHSIWNDDPVKWSNVFQEANQYLSTFSGGFNMHLHERMSMEEARDNVHELLYENDPKMFPIGANYINVADLASAMSVLSQPVAESEYECTQCHHTIQARSEINYFAELQCSVLDIQHSETIAHILGKLLSIKTNKSCPNCNKEMLKNTYINGARYTGPRILVCPEDSLGLH